MSQMVKDIKCKMSKKFYSMHSRKGMELVQVGILIAVAVGLGLVFKDKTGQFVNNTFSTLLGSNFG